MGIHKKLAKGGTWEDLSDKVTAYVNKIKLKYDEKHNITVKELDSMKMVPDWVEHEYGRTTEQISHYDSIGSDALEEILQMDGYKYKLEDLLASEDRFDDLDKEYILKCWEENQHDKICSTCSQTVRRTAHEEDAATVKERFKKASKIFLEARANVDERVVRIQNMDYVKCTAKMLVTYIGCAMVSYTPSEGDKSSSPKDEMQHHRSHKKKKRVWDSSSSPPEDEMQHHRSQRKKKRVRDSSSSPEDEMQHHHSQKKKKKMALDSDQSLVPCC